MHRIIIKDIWRCGNYTKKTGTPQVSPLSLLVKRALQYFHPFSFFDLFLVLLPVVTIIPCMYLHKDHILSYHNEGNNYQLGLFFEEELKKYAEKWNNFQKLSKLYEYAEEKEGSKWREGYIGRKVHRNCFHKQEKNMLFSTRNIILLLSWRSCFSGCCSTEIQLLVS